MYVIIDNALAQMKICLTAFENKSKSGLNAVQPEEVSLPGNTSASGSNLFTTETIMRDGLQYIRYIAPTSLVRTLYSLNAVANSRNEPASTWKPTLYEMEKTISDAQFEIGKNLNEFNKTFDSAFKRIAEVYLGFKGMTDYVYNKIHNPMENLQASIANLAKSAGPMLVVAGRTPQAAEVFGNAVLVVQDAIKGASDCYGKMGSYISNAISTALSEAIRIINIQYVTRFETSVVMSYLFSSKRLACI